jgi:hypothetical protein
VKSGHGGSGWSRAFLEPNEKPAGRDFQQAMFSQKIPVAAFQVDDLAPEVLRLRIQGVVFVTEPSDAGAVWIAVLADTCGNLIQTTGSGYTFQEFRRQTAALNEHLQCK